MVKNGRNAVRRVVRMLLRVTIELVEAVNKEVRHIHKQVFAMRIELDCFKCCFGLGGEIERVGAREIDRAGLLHDLNGAIELGGIIGAA